MEKLKYIRIKDHGSIIMFPQVISHSELRHLRPISAGFCVVNIEKKRVDCFGKSIGLELEANVKDDTIWATGQVFGTEAMMAVISSLKDE